MFNNKKIKELEDKVEQQRVAILKLEHFVKEKPKHKIGDKLNGKICVAVYQHPLKLPVYHSLGGTVYGGTVYGFEWLYEWRSKNETN